VSFQLDRRSDATKSAAGMSEHPFAMYDSERRCEIAGRIGAHESSRPLSLLS
jgi:hypothetical protein